MSESGTVDFGDQDLPAGWASVSLSELGAWTGGGTPRKSHPAYWKGDVPWVSPKDMKSIRLADTQDHISESAIEDSAAKSFPPNSIAFVVRSGILEHTLPISLIPFRGTANQDMKILTPSPEINAEWLLYALLGAAPDIRERCRKDGTTVASIEFPQLKQYRIGLPPSAEQDRIVETLEQHVQRVNEGMDDVRDALTLLPQMRAACLAAAFEGGSVEVHKLDDLATIQSGITKSPPKGIDLIAVPYIRTANVQAGFLDLNEVKELHVTEEQRARHLLRIGDVLVLEGGDADKVGRGWIWADEVPGAIHQNHVFAVRPDPDRLDGRYLAYFVNAPQARAYFLSKAKQTTNLASINKTQLRALPVSTPSIERQREIAQRLDRELVAISTLREVVAERIREAEALHRALLSEAFRGRLVPQDPADEPVSEPLRRIRDETAAANLRVEASVS